jgi:hypothetical protein
MIRNGSLHPFCVTFIVTHFGSPQRGLPMTIKKKPDQGLVLTIPQAAKRLQMSAQSAYAAAKRGDLPTVTIGSLIRVPVAAFEQKFGKGR